MIRLANTPTPHITSVAQSVLDLFRGKGSLAKMHRPIPAPEPSPEPNPEPDGAMRALRSTIAPDDWDELFRAIQARLEHCFDDAQTKTPELPLHDRHLVAKAVVMQCIESMKQLQNALTKERQAREKH
jgi:hypothetical protein